ncbi:Calycin-like protein [Aspergillus coremiiformis]|uniref:Calycin-like protein n=1 Tax=Aspergillus coremiiformis TaxID=138285 RepID=A0A5N6ZAW9_9EURO|nr:Calycin-like protein [Aspergillus coremiiformis]
MPVLPSLQRSSFNKDLRNRHLIYDYAAQDADRNQEKWRYEMWLYNEDRINYPIHRGPMAGRVAFQSATYQCIRPGELWQCNWLETGTICSLVFDIAQKRTTTLIAFCNGDWEQNKAAHGDRRNQEDLARMRALGKIGTQVDRILLSEQAEILEDFHGPGNLKQIEMDLPTL